MRIVCPSCETSYEIPDGKIGREGREVRCARCATKWHAVPAESAAPARPKPQPVSAPRPQAASDFHLEAPAGVAVTDAPEPMAQEAESEDPPDWEAVAPPEHPGDAERAVTKPRMTPVVAASPAPSVPAVAAPAPPKVKLDYETLAKPKVIVAQRAATNIFAVVRKYQWIVRGHLTRRRVPLGMAIFLLALMLPVGLVVMRTTVVRQVPHLAGLYARLGMPVNLRGLDFSDIRTYREMENGQPVLVVEGGITNLTLESKSVPAVRFALRGPGGQEIYAWSADPKATTVPSGDVVRFRSKLASPPEDAVDVQLRFLERKTRQAANP